MVPGIEGIFNAISILFMKLPPKIYHEPRSIATSNNGKCSSHNDKIGRTLVRLPTIFLAGLVSRLMRSVSYRDSELYIELSVQNTPVQYQYRNQKSMPMETSICAGGMP